MSIELKEKINLLANQVNLKMEIKISYIKLREGLGLCDKDNEKAMEFYHFCKDFFNIWERYLNRLSPLVNEFNRKGNTVDFKQIYAEILSEQYEKYLDSLQYLKVPAFLKESFELFLDSVIGKQKYFKLYSNDLIDGKISRIKNNAIEQESKFWLDLYKKNVEIESLLKEFGTKNRN